MVHRLGTVCVSTSHPESLGREKAADSFEPPLENTSHFLRRLSLRILFEKVRGVLIIIRAKLNDYSKIHHGEVKAETIRGVRFGSSPNSPLPVKSKEA